MQEGSLASIVIVHAQQFFRIHSATTHCSTLCVYDSTCHLTTSRKSARTSMHKSASKPAPLQARVIWKPEPKHRTFSRSIASALVRLNLHIRFFDAIAFKVLCCSGTHHNFGVLVHIGLSFSALIRLSKLVKVSIRSRLLLDQLQSWTLSFQLMSKSVV
jgi:hypothetical protein